MAKNNLSKAMRPLLEKMTCRVYAVFVIALVDCYGWTPEEAEKICELSQALWNESNNKNIDIFKWCKDVSGLDMSLRMHESSKCDSCAGKGTDICNKCNDYSEWHR